MKQHGLFDPPPAPAADDGKPKLMPVQLDLLERGRVPYEQGCLRVIWQAPCASGKTWVSAEQTRRALTRFPNTTILHMVHRRRLVDQMLSTLNDFGVYASPIMEGRSTWNSRVYCASRDTLLSILKAGQDLPRPDLLIIDECHTQAEEVLQWFLHNCPRARWTGMTATPIYSNGRSMKPPYQALVCMAPTSEMIALGRLCPVKVYNPDEIGRARRKGKKVKPVGDPIDHWKKYAADLPTVVFAATVADSKTICQRYNDAGITAEHIDANTPEEEREDIFLRSRRGITKIISNCNVLIEGLDLPWLACCQILRGCNSLILWIQASGRVMRAYPGKSHGILLDHAGAAHEFGLPDTDYQWSLDDERTNTLRNKPPKDRKPVTCQGCGAMFVGKQACPECGRVLPRQRRHSLLASVGGDGLLTEYNGDRPNFARQEILERLWKRCLFISRAKGGDLKRAAAIFTAQAKVPPWEANLSTPLPDRSQWNTSAREWLEVHG